jgi:hypothetical protein
MAESKKKLSAFGSAARPGGFTVDVTAQDMLDLHPAWSAERAKRFLTRHSDGAAKAMLQAAMMYLMAAAMREGDSDVN